MLIAILVTMGLDGNLDVSWPYGVPWVALISLVYFVRRGRLRAVAAGSRGTREDRK